MKPQLRSNLAPNNNGPRAPERIYMIINVKDLVEAGLRVRVYDGPNRKPKDMPLDNDLRIEIYSEGGNWHPAVIDTVHEIVSTPEYRDVVLSGFHRVLETFHILEVISRSEAK